MILNSLQYLIEIENLLRFFNFLILPISRTQTAAFSSLLNHMMMKIYFTELLVIKISWNQWILRWFSLWLNHIHRFSVYETHLRNTKHRTDRFALNWFFKLFKKFLYAYRLTIIVIVYTWHVCRVFFYIISWFISNEYVQQKIPRYHQIYDLLLNQ